MNEHLFVYGTLAPGHPHEHVLADLPGTWVPATLHGRLVHEGRGIEHGYPAIVLDEHRPDRVAGYLFSSEALAGHWGQLDDFEGESHTRVAATVEVEGGGHVTAWVYVLSAPGTGG